MYLLAHLGITAFIGFILDKKTELIDSSKKKFNLNNSSFFWALLLLGSMIPDIIDKTIGIMVFSSGRAIGHTLLFTIFQCITFYILISVLKFDFDRKLGVFFLFIGNLMHFLLDQPSLGIDIILYPILTDKFLSSPDNSFLLGITNPFVWITETLGFMSIIFLGKSYQKNKQFWFVLFLFILSYLSLISVLYYFLVILE